MGRLDSFVEVKTLVLVATATDARRRVVLMLSRRRSTRTNK
jgi:hypothetical protein